MPPMIRPSLAFAISVLTAALVAAQSPEDGRTAIVLHPGVERGLTDAGPLRFDVVPGGTVRVDGLSLAEAVEGLLVEVLERNPGPPLRLQIQYATSVSILNELNRLEALDAKRDSAWRDLERDASGRFRVGPVRDGTRATFPRIEGIDSAASIRSFSESGAARLRIYPATVRLDAVRLRLIRGAPDKSFVLEFVRPGC